jgi:N-acetylmuramoyl-L-alanine amidase
MKIAIRGGHNYQVTGAHGIVNEVTEDRKIYARVIDFLKQLGHQVLDVTPDRTNTSAEDLSYGVNKANAWGADYFASIHLNATPGGYGTEVLYKSTKGKEYAEKIVKELAILGFRNRGAKQDVRGLYEFNHVKAPNNIVECFFCDSQSDVDLYNKVGVDVIAKAIVKGITEQTVQDAPKPSSGIVTASTLNVRAGAGTGYKVIGTLKKGNKVKIDKAAGDWYSIYFGDHGGFVHKNYIKLV